MTSEVKENRFTKYFREVRAEVRKVTWPSREEVLRLSAIVIVVMILMSAFMAIIDFAFSRLMAAIISLGTGL